MYFKSILILFLDLKHLEMIMACSLVPFLAIAFIMDESPRWLLSKGQVKEAKVIIAKMIKTNKKPTENISKLQVSEQSSQKGTIWDIMTRPGMRRNQLLLCVYWLGTSMSTYGLNF